MYLFFFFLVLFYICFFIKKYQTVHVIQTDIRDHHASNKNKKQNKTRGSQEPESLTNLIFFPFKGNNSNKELSDNLTQRNLIVLILQIISSIENYFLSIIIIKILAENCKKHHFSPFKDNNSNKKSFDNFNPMQTFVSLIMRIISTIERIWLNLSILEIYAKNFCLTPMFYF